MTTIWGGVTKYTQAQQWELHSYCTCQQLLSDTIAYGIHSNFRHVKLWTYLHISRTQGQSPRKQLSLMRKQFPRAQKHHLCILCSSSVYFSPSASFLFTRPTFAAPQGTWSVYSPYDFMFPLHWRAYIDYSSFKFKFFVTNWLAELCQLATPVQSPV